jgi:ABC-type branched-subunit amino acid transport system ATPase component
MFFSIDHLNISFGGIKAVRDCSFDIEDKGTIVGLIGPNGSGKTTIFNLVTGFLKPNKGRIFFGGKNITHLKPYQISRLGVGRTFQIVRLFPRLTILQNLIVATQNGTMNEIIVKALDLLGSFEMMDFKDTLAGNLSYGQQKLVEFAKVLMGDPKLILLDEPAAGLNVNMIERLTKYIHDLQQKEYTFLIVEHNLPVIMNLCHKVILLNQGEKIAEGSPEEIKNNKRVIELYLGE